jgi:hypothetical protein
MSVRMFESLRQFGGSLAESNAVAVIARTSPPLDGTTQQRFRALGVECVRATPHRRYSWYHFLNKPIALLAAEGVTHDGVMVFLDADTLVLRSPDELLLAEDVEVAGCPSDDGVVGSVGPQSPYDAEWDHIARANGVALSDLPWVQPHDGGPPIRLYLNGGVIGYRRESGYAQRYLRACERALDARSGFPGDGEHWVEQICIGIAVVADHLRWRALSQSHNYAMASYLPERYTPLEFRAARILHYHDSMSPTFWPTLLERVEKDQPHAYDWLRARGPLRNETALAWRATAELLRARRGISRRLYRRRVGLRG